MDDLLLRGCRDARQLLGADLNSAALNGPSPQGDRTETPGGGSDSLVVSQEGRFNRSGQVCPLVLQGLDLLIDSGELGVACGGELTSGRADLILLPAEALRLLSGRVKSLHGGNLSLLQGGLALTELVDLALDGGQVAGGAAAGVETLAQDLGTAHYLADLVLAAGCLRLGLTEGGIGLNSGPFVGLEVLDD